MADDARVQVTIVGRQVGVVEAASETRIALAALEAQSAELSAKMRTFGADALAAVRGGESISSLVPRFVELDATIAATRAQMAALKAEAAAPIPFLARSDYKPPTQAIHHATVNPATLAAVTRELEQQTTVTRQLGAAASEYDAISAAQLQTRLATLRSESVAMRRNAAEEEKASIDRLKYTSVVAPQSSIAAQRRSEKEASDAQAQTRLAALRAESDAMRRNASEEAAAAVQRDRTASQSLGFISGVPALAPQSEVTAHHAAVAKMINDLEKYDAERNAITTKNLQFASSIAPQSSIAARRALDKDLFDAETANYARLAERQRAATSEMIANLRAYGAERERAAAQSLDFVSKISPQTAIKFTGGGTSGELKAIAAEAEHAGRSMTSNSNVIRHAFGMMDSAMRGSRGQFFSSLGAMIRDAGLFTTALEAVGPAGLAVGAGLAVATATLGYFAYEAYKDYENTQQIVGSLALFGNASAETATHVETLRDTMANAFDLSRASARNLAAEMLEIPGITQQDATALANFAAVAASSGVSGGIDKIGEAIAKAAREGPAALHKLAESWGYVGEQAGTVSGEIEKVNAAIDKQSEAAARGASKLADYANQISAIAAASGGMDAAALMAAASIPPPKIPTPREVAASQHPLPAYPGMAADLDKALLAETREKQLQGEINSLLTVRQQLNERIAKNPNDVGATDALLRNLRAVAELEQKQTHTHTPIETEAYEKHKEALEEQLRLAQNNSAKQIAIRKDMAAADAAYYGAGQAEAQRSADAVTSAQVHAAFEGTQAQINGIRAAVAATQQGSTERVAAEDRVLQVKRSAQHTDVAGNIVSLYSPAAIISQEGRVTTARREQQRQQYSDFKQEKEAELEAAKGDTDKIIAIYAQMRAQLAAVGTAAPHGESSRLAREEIAKLKQAQADLFRDAERGATAQERVDAARIASFRASQRAEVASHGESKAQEATNEQQFTASVMAGEEQRTEAMLQNTNLTRDQKDQLYQHLAELYAKDAEQQQQAEERITAAIEAENAKRIALFTNMFDTVGSSLEKLGTAELTGNLRARGEALRSLGTSLVSSGIHAVGSLASDWAGKEIGPSLGLSQEQSKGGLGEVLGNVVAKQLGLLKETPKTDQQKAAELFQKAADAQDKAAGTFGKSVETFADASKRIADAMAKLTGTPTTHVGTGPTADIAAKVRQYESGGNYNEGYGGADLSNMPLGPTGFPQWAGKMGPAGNSRAAGAYQFEPAEWDRYAKPLGVTDFSPASQDKVFNAAYSTEGLKPWESNKQLMAAVGGSTAAPPLAGGSADAAGEIQYKISTQQSSGPTSAMGPYGPMSVPAPATAPQMSMAAGTPQPVEQAQKAANDQLSTSVRSLDTTTRNATAVGQQSVTATTATTAQGQQTATALGADKTANDALRGATTESKTAQDGLTSATKSQQTAVEQNTTALKQPPKAAATTATGTSASATAGVPTNALTGANDNAAGSSSWALLTQGLGVASGALALFGSNLSTGAREVLGGVAVITQLTSFTKNLNQTFDLFGTATKTASTATTLSGAATTTNAADFALNSVAVQTNATAQTTAAATSAASGAAKGLFGLGILGLAEGGVVYAADGWPSRGTDTVPAMLTPGETVLSVAQTRAMASNANFASASVGGVHPNFQTLTPPPAAANHNAASTFNYSPQISGRFGSMSRGEVNNILRSHGDAFTGMARNFVRNNGGLYGR